MNDKITDKRFSYEDVEHIAIKEIQLIKEKLKNSLISQTEYDVYKKTIFDLLDKLYHFER